jgi:hypothetical protein
MSTRLTPGDRIESVHGRVGLWHVRDSGLVEPITYKANQIQYDWGFIAARCIGMGDRSYAVRFMYIEYENVADPDDPVTVPSFGRDEGRDYYDQLSMTGTRDYLRVALITQPAIGVVPGYEDYFLDPEVGNKLTFFAQSSGSAGMGMVPFGAGSNSKIYGAALVAAPAPNDPSRDRIFSRAYFDVAEQTVKEVSSQIGVTWEIAFTAPTP